MEWRRWFEYLDRASGNAMGTVLTPEAAPGVMDQCTRDTPRSVRSFWTPAAGQILALEAKLQPVLQDALDRVSRRGEQPLRASDFYRQYVGIVHQNGRRAIYVNGFHSNFAQFHARLKVPGMAIDTLHWRAEAVPACDGGTMFFGIEFDPERNRFSGLKFNRRAG